MKILYVNIKSKDKQGDLAEIITLRGLRNILGDNCIDYPKKKILYGDFSEVPKNSLHGLGFSLYRSPIQDITDRDISKADVVLYGYANKNHYVNDFYPEVEALKLPTFYIDGHDDSDVVVTPCFKHEVHNPQAGVYPMNLGIPKDIIYPLDFTFKNKLIPQSTPDYALFGQQILGTHARQKYKFQEEDKYYEDIRSSWVGLSCKRGSWDAFRNYEILAAGTLLLIRDYDLKPKFCSPIDLPTISYSSIDQLNSILPTLITPTGPTQKYIDLLHQQREWLLENGTCEAIASKIYNTICTITKQ
jgi:hypothetical protein